MALAIFLTIFFRRGLTRGLDLTTVHSEQDARTPVQEAQTYRVSDRPDDLASKTAEVLPLGAFFAFGDVDGYIFEEDGDALHWFVAQWTLVGGQLEGVGDLVGEVLRCESVGSSGLAVGLIVLCVRFTEAGELLVDALEAVDELHSQFATDAVWRGVDQEVRSGPSGTKCCDLIYHVLPDFLLALGLCKSFFQLFLEIAH